MAKYELKEPKGWATVTVADVGEVRLGRQRSPDKHTGRFITKYLRAANITTKGLDLGDVLVMDFTPVERDVFRLQSGDIVLAEASGSPAHVGRPAIWRDNIPDCCYQNTVIRFRPHNVTPEFALIVFRHFVTAGVFGRTARGVGIQHLGASRFAQLRFPLPPLSEQVRIAEETEPRLAELWKAEASLRSAMQRTAEQDREILASAVAGKLVEQEAVLAHREQRSFQDAQSLLTQTSYSSGMQGLLFKPSESVDNLEQGTDQHSLPQGWVWIRVSDAGELKLGRQKSPKHQLGVNPIPYPKGIWHRVHVTSGSTTYDPTIDFR